MIWNDSGGQAKRNGLLSRDEPVETSINFNRVDFSNNVKSLKKKKRGEGGQAIVKVVKIIWFILFCPFVSYFLSPFSFFLSF